MKYIDRSVGSAYIPKLLGIYERELWPQVEELVIQSPRLVVDVGAAEGYYAVGFARRLPRAEVVAFEMDPIGQVALDEMITLNGVAGRVTQRGKCEPDLLNQVLNSESSAVVICDVEGYEQVLLDPSLIPGLRNVPVLVELHDFLVPGVEEALVSRFEATHSIKKISQESRHRRDFPWVTVGTAILPRSYLHWAVSEWRPVQMSWLYMRPVTSLEPANGSDRRSSS